MPRVSVGIYSPHPSIQYARNVLAKLERTSGKTVDEWIKVTKNSGLPTEKERQEWLQLEHKLGSNTSWWLAEMSFGRGREGIEEAAYLAAAPGYVEAMYAAKPALKPLHDRLIVLGRSLGKDVKVCPCETIVPLYRNHVIAQIKPATKSRIDFGLALGETPGKGRLVETGGFAKKDRITHKIAIGSEGDIDPFVARWLKVAYDRDAN
ncbi:MAG: DUF5655 domain-containing protein [Gemmataceae bacterium]